VLEKVQLEQQMFLDVIRERRSVRAYDPAVQISREEMTEILELATLAPSSSNLQPWRFLVIDKPELKEKLLPIAFNQQQVVEASAVIAVLGDVESYKKADKIYGQAVEAGFMPADTANHSLNGQLACIQTYRLKWLAKLYLRMAA
jgi:nitroreductase